MPLKACPVCPVGNGPNAHRCKGCGHEFVKGSRVVNQMMVAERPPAIVRTSTEPRPRPTFTAPRPNFSPIYTSEINFDPGDHFADMVERENQLFRVCASIRNYVKSAFRLRNHMMFFGPTSAGKTSFLTRTLKMVGEEHCYRVEAQTATKAGVVDQIKSKRNAIKVLAIDELEKNIQPFGWLLSVLEEGKFQQVQSDKYKGETSFDFTPLVIVTVNNVAKLESYESGAFFDRLKNRIYFPPISDEALFEVLKKYVDMIDGKYEWIPKVIEYMRENEETDDLRKMIAILTDGGELWEDGTYAKILQATSSS